MILLLKYFTVYISIFTGELEGISAIVSSLDSTNKEQLLSRCSAGPGDLILFAVGHHPSVHRTLDRLRLFIANQLGLVDHVCFGFVWFMKYILPLVSYSLTSIFFSASNVLVQAFDFVGDWFPNVWVEWNRAEAWGLSFNNFASWNSNEISATLSFR